MIDYNFIIEQFKLLDKGEFKNVYSIIKAFGLKKSWVYELYRRYKNEEPLKRARKQKKEVFDLNQKYTILNFYEKLCIITETEVKIPSIKTFMDIFYEAYPDYPRVSRETFRKLFKNLDIYKEKNKNKVKRYRKRFEAEYVGQIIQGDVSEHDWIPGCKPFGLLAFMDDHSRYILYADFIESDNVHTHVNALKEIFNKYGKPIAIYYDNDPKYRKSGSVEERKNRIVLGGLEELGIRVINSTPYTPQGKGKIERFFKTIQREIIFYMKYKNVNTLEEARNVLKEYIEKYNNRFHEGIGTTPKQRFLNDRSVFIKLKNEDIEKIENAFTEKDTRFVDNANEISYNGVKWKVPKYKNMPLAGYKVEVREFPGKWIKIFYKGNFIVKYDLVIKNNLENYGKTDNLTNDLSDKNYNNSICYNKNITNNYTKRI